MKKKNILKLLFCCFGFFIVCILFIVYANYKIPAESKPYLYSEADSIPQENVALVLGCSRYLGGGYENPYFKYRINAAKELYDAKKVKAFVVSGDNGRKEYNEAQDMKDALMEVGVPDSIIYLDYAGFRTLDSVVRMKEIFGQNSFIIVSQEFHNERAVYIAQHKGLTTYGYNAKDVSLNRISFRTKIREKLARVKVFIDILTNKKPRFLGEPVEIKNI